MTLSANPKPAKRSGTIGVKRCYRSIAIAGLWHEGANLTIVTTFKLDGAEMLKIPISKGAGRAHSFMLH